MEHVFRSSRLTYRAIDSQNDETFLHSLSLDPLGYSNSNTAILKPVSRKDTSAYLTFFTEKTLIGVLVCLANSNTTTFLSHSGTSYDCDIAIGSIFLTKPEPGNEHHRNSEMGLDIHKDYRNVGYGTEAIEWVLDWGFKIAGLHRIAVSCFEWNGAQRVYQRLGFMLEGRRREALWYYGGWKDLLEFGMLEEEWRRKDIDTEAVEDKGGDSD